MTDLYDLEKCVREYKGQETSTPYLDQFSPTLVTAEALANNLGLDAVMGVKFVKATFKPHSDEYVPEPPAELVALAAVEAAAVNLPEAEQDAILDAVETARKSLGFEKFDDQEPLVFADAGTEVPEGTPLTEEELKAVTEAEAESKPDPETVPVKGKK